MGCNGGLHCDDRGGAGGFRSSDRGRPVEYARRTGYVGNLRAVGCDRDAGAGGLRANRYGGDASRRSCRRCVFCEPGGTMGMLRRCDGPGRAEDILCPAGLGIGWGGCDPAGTKFSGALHLGGAGLDGAGGCPFRAVLDRRANTRRAARNGGGPGCRGRLRQSLLRSDSLSYRDISLCLASLVGDVPNNANWRLRVRAADALVLGRSCLPVRRRCDGVSCGWGQGDQKKGERPRTAGVVRASWLGAVVPVCRGMAFIGWALTIKARWRMCRSLSSRCHSYRTLAV